MILFQTSLTLLLCLLLQLTFVCLFVVGLLFGTEDVGDKLITDLFRVGLTLEETFFVCFNNLIMKGIFY